MAAARKYFAATDCTNSFPHLRRCSPTTVIPSDSVCPKSCDSRKMRALMRALKGESLPAIRLPTRLSLPLVCFGSAALALAAGAAVPRIDSQMALRIAVGLPFILLLLRHRFALLVAWIVVG